MKLLHYFPLHNITICDFCELLKSIINDYNNLCTQYNVNEFKATAKRLLTHCIIINCCNTAISVEKGKVIFYYNDDCINLTPELTQYIQKIIDDCRKNMPISWYCSSKPLSYYIGLIEQHQATSFLTQLRNNKRKYTFDRAFKYLTAKKLTFLNDHYFRDLKTRCLLVNN